jgi:abortive infection bacteriophage resistance protein
MAIIAPTPLSEHSSQTRTRGLISCPCNTHDAVAARPPTPYTKPALPPVGLLAHLQTRGLVVPDPVGALDALQHIGYYRLLIYMRPLQLMPQKIFIPGTTFQQILDVYNFDRELRLLCLDAIERIEVALRASIVTAVAVPHTPHFFLDPQHFERLDAFVEFYQTASRAKYLGIQHYRDTYGSPDLAPIWTMMEAITFGSLSRLYSGLRLHHRKAIATHFGYDETILVSWFRSLNMLRNMCAHHNRLWNFHMLVDQPKAAKKFRSEMASTDRLYARVIVLLALLDGIAHGSDWKQRLIDLIDRFPGIPTAAMGFPADWRLRAVWK